MVRSLVVRLAAFAAIAVPLGLASAAVPATRGARLASIAKPGTGKFLVARREMRDPNFAKTVVLLIDHGPGGALGLVINRPSEIPLSALAEAFEGLAARDEPIFHGGPVPSEIPFVLFPAEEPSEGASRVVDDVWVSRSVDVLRRLSAGDGDDRPTFRLYAGYAGWAPGQLESEVERGDWHVVVADRESIFSDRPETLWSVLLPPVPSEQARLSDEERREPAGQRSADRVFRARRIHERQLEALAQTSAGQ